MAILTREGLDCSVIKFQEVTDGRILSLLRQLKSQIVNRVNMYCPGNPCHRPEFIASTAYYFIKTHQWTQLQLGYFPFQPVVHNWFIKGRGMYCSVYGNVHIRDSLLLIEKSSLCGGSGFPSKKCVNVTI